MELTTRPQSQDDEPGSDESTRSRSRHRDVSQSKASGDSSYQSHLPAPADTNASCGKPSQDLRCKWMPPALLHLEVRVFDALDTLISALHFGRKLVAEGSACTRLPAQQREPPFCLAVRKGDEPSLHALPCKLSVITGFCPPGLLVKLGDTPSLQARVNNSSQGAGPAQVPALRDLHDRSPARWQPPALTIAAPEFVDNPPAPVPLRALFVVLCEDFRPEVIPLTFWQPADYFLAIREVQALRLPDVRRYFPRLLAIEPQPCSQFAVLLGFTGLRALFAMLFLTVALWVAMSSLDMLTQRPTAASSWQLQVLRTGPISTSGCLLCVTHCLTINVQGFLLVPLCP